ncbi:MarR family transcriptional regulator [Acetobacterium paludosum]|uniref:MarR family transcriptional regulator n=1 Tax=Acetobacterium paludosum TaxID=52693 RepID=A0A923HSZ7_9FIRM|nr:MarR family transcriptional regulator [Acetobacterium paludosum]MBC3887207.1 MarR family transcriptional regulator [Acetobacterium paludosum]
MKKEKKSKKLDIKEGKDSKKETKKKNLNEEKKVGVISKKSKSVPQDNIQPTAGVDYAVLKKLMIDSAVLYQNILVLPQAFNVSNHSYSLFPSELKALDMIGHFSGINLTQLANKIGISKSAISKCTSKLLEKELIKKEKSPINVREVVFTLSEDGQSIFSQLDHAHSDLFRPFNRVLESLSIQETNELHHVFLDIHSRLEEILDNL